MSDVKESKAREAIPDVQLSISQARHRTEEIQRQVDRVNYALSGPKATSPDCEDKADREMGSVECLEESSKALVLMLSGVEKELRQLLDLLFGVE